jgi:lipopolysaccharide/colanic/teichoic acid biosynthesis glycosyltransferase
VSKPKSQRSFTGNDEPEATQKAKFLAGSVMRVLDWIVALVLLIGLSPVMLALMALMYAYSPKTIFAFSWRIGLRGKLFKALKFHTSPNHPNSRPTSIERWMRKYRLDEIPQLLNVLRGEMSLLGVRPLTLSQVVQPDPKAQQQMNVLVGDERLVNLLLKPNQK